MHDDFALGRALDAQRKSEARFQAALANSGVRAFEHDSQLRYTWMHSTQFYELSAVIGKTDADLFAPDDARRLMALKARVLETGVRVKEDVHVTVNGRRYDYLLTIDPLRDAAGKVVGLTGASTDITVAKEAQRELASALEFRDRVLGILAHDLRNPLGAISTAAYLLSRRSLDAAEQKHVSRIDRSAARMQELIASLLDFADCRFRSSVRLTRAEADLSEVVRRVVDELSAAHPGRTIALDVEGDARGIWDASRLAQVASNLIGNALKHGAALGTVRTRIQAEGSSVLLRVANEGPVISPEKMRILFEPFATETTPADTSPQRGLGLGLYIAHEIVRAHGGSIAVESTRETGTVFSVRLPRGQNEVAT